MFAYHYWKDNAEELRTLCFKRGFMMRLMRVLFFYITLTAVREIDYKRIQTVCDIV